MSQNSNNSENQEIDLSIISNKIKGFFESINASIYNLVLFFKKKSLLILGLAFIGFSLGYYLDTTIKSYNNEVIVLPAIESTEYLYSKVQLLQSKVKSKDTLFFKAIGIEHPDKISSIEIKPIIDIYSFINSPTDKASQNFEFIKLLSEDTDIKKVIEDKLTSRNYSRHILNIKMTETTTEKNTITPLLKYLNENEYLEKLRNAYIFNIKNKILKDEEMILQINTLLNEFSASRNNKKSDKLIYYNENTQINEIITSKTNFINDIANLKVELINMDSFIKKTSVIINNKDTTGLHGKLFFILPFLFIFLYLFNITFMNFYKKQSLKALNNKA